MRRLFLFFILSTIGMWSLSILRADQTVTVTATNSDISQDLDLKTVATLFGQAKDLEQFEQMLNNPDSAFSNLDLNADGNVDYLRVIETADQNRHLVVIQAVLAKDVYQDVASIFVEKDPESEAVTVQVIGDEYIYGSDSIIEPVYIYRPVIYDWFWGASWVCWHSPFYWDYWPTWWHPYHCIAHHLYWDHCYWHHHHYPICTYRTGHHYHAHYRPMRETVSRADYATRHPERSFATRNASRNYNNARAIERDRASAVRTATPSRNVTDATTRVSPRSTATRTFGSTNIRTADRSATVGRGSATRVENTGVRTATRNVSTSQTATRSQSTAVRPSSTPTRNSATVTTTTRRSDKAVATPVRASSTVNRVSTTPTATRSTMPTATRSTAPTINRSSSTPVRSSSNSVVRSSGSSSMRSSAGSYSSGSSSMRSSGGGSSSRGGGSGTRR